MIEGFLSACRQRKSAAGSLASVCSAHTVSSSWSTCVDPLRNSKRAPTPWYGTRVVIDLEGDRRLLRDP